MTTDDLATVLGVVFGVVASIPTALLIAAATTRRVLRQRVLDVPYMEFDESQQETSVIVYEVPS